MISSTCLQLLVAIAPSWDATSATLQKYERQHSLAPWEAVSSQISAVLGKQGLAWGIGHHSVPSAPVYRKREGDNRSPAGLFSLGSAFGFSAESALASLQVDCLFLKETIEAVDDPSSRYYNQIVDRAQVIVDWNSAEKMNDEPLYALGLEVQHNFPAPRPGEGSAIFMHLWRGPGKGTAGCTAMSREDLTELLCWLRRDKKPQLLQLPRAEYFLWQKQGLFPEELA